jgi:hypothetical protein
MPVHILMQQLISRALRYLDFRDIIQFDVSQIIEECKDNVAKDIRNEFIHVHFFSANNEFQLRSHESNLKTRRFLATF